MKTLIIVNGLIIPAFFLFMLCIYISDLIKRGSDYKPASIIVGEDLDKAKKDSLALQGIEYKTPIEVYNSTNFYLPVAVKTYEDARKIKKIGPGFLDYDKRSTLSVERTDDENFFNVLFLNQDYKVIGQLLDRKAAISSIFVNDPGNRYMHETIDKSVSNIAYLIGFEDSNKDGKLNFTDDHDLYISDLDGKNLTQVTSQKEIIDYRFINSNSELFVRFKDRNDLRDEYKPVKFALYKIESKTLTELKEIESKLKEIESRLVR